VVQFNKFHNRFKHLFQTKTRSLTLQSYQYLKGLFQASKKNMERMAEAVPDSNDQRFQHFLSKSPWDEDAVIDKLAQEANGHIGGHPDSCLLLDETAIVKKGAKSVGVARQYCGELGKVDNCQVAVFAVLAHQQLATPIDCRLFLPRSWTDDPQRCHEAGVPAEYLDYQRKQDLALQLVLSSRARGAVFNWVGCDGLYGEDPGFLRSLTAMGEVFMADVHKDQRIYLEDPSPQIPAPSTQRGRKPTRLKARSKPLRVDRWTEEQPENSWQRFDIRATTKGKLKVAVLHRRVWLWDGKEPKAQCWHLIVRKTLGPEEIKYSVSNAPSQTPVKRLVYMQGQRYLIERIFQDSKNQCGLDQYQARGWRSWHHHMTMVMLGMLFMVGLRLHHKKAYPLLSCTDIVELLSHYLPQRKISEEEIFRQLEIRHQRRQQAIESANRKQSQEEISSNGNVTK
jgi:SRSO17 transposase